MLFCDKFYDLDGDGELNTVERALMYDDLEETEREEREREERPFRYSAVEDLDDDENEDDDEDDGFDDDPDDDGEEW